MQNHRGCPRWQINWQAKVRIGDKEGLTDCHIKDINFKGLKLTLAEKLTPDTFVKLSLILSSDFVLNVEAWVAWHKTIHGHNLYGLYFSKIKELDKEKIYQFMRGYFPEKINQQWWQDLSVEKGGEIMQKEDVRDRRIFARLPVRFPLRFLSPGTNKESQAQTQDISAKGIGFLTNEELSAHSPLEMWLEIPDKGEPLYTRGEVAWSKSQGRDEYRVGVNLERADLMGMSRVLRT